MNRLLIELMLAGSLALLTGCSASHRTVLASPHVAAAVALERVLAPASSWAYTGPATVEPVHTYALAFEIPGRVTRVAADVGDRVSAGEELAALDTESYEAQERAGEAQARAASALARRALDGARPQEIAQASAALDRASAAADLAHADARRAAMLYADGAISAQENDNALHAQRDADAAVAAARAQLSLTHQGARVEDREAALAQADAARASAANGEAILHKAHLVAPADAFVQSRMTELGNYAGAGSTVFVLTDAREPQIQAAVPERIVSGLKVGDAAMVEVGAERMSGRITRIAPQADAASRTRRVTVVADGLRTAPGAVVVAHLGALRSGSGEFALGALLMEHDRPWVLVYDQVTGRLTRREVNVVRADGERVIVNGVTPGDRVVVAGQHQVQPGQAVRIVAQDGSR